MQPSPSKRNAAEPLKPNAAEPLKPNATEPLKPNAVEPLKLKFIFWGSDAFLLRGKEKKKNSHESHFLSTISSKCITEITVSCVVYHGGKKNKKKVFITERSMLVPLASTDSAEWGLTSQSERDAVRFPSDERIHLYRFF